jgi:spore maturation protein CgeB
MPTESRRVMLVGHYPTGALERSWCAAFEALRWQVHSFDLIQAVNDHCRGGRFGRLFNAFVPVEPWIRKANRDLILAALESQPDLVVSFGHYPLRVGALAQIRAATDAALVHVWPDTLLNWRSDLTPALPLYDLLATYSRATVPLFQALGAQRAAWVPLGGDPELHAPPVEWIESPLTQDIEVSFVGGWRSEREAVLKQLDKFDLRIWGPDWGRRSSDKEFIRRTWQGRALYGREFTEVVARSKISLNIIDPTNHPAANMRFFEIPTARGLQVCSACPEMEDEFRHDEHLFYYKSPGELPDLVRSLLDDGTLRARVALSGHKKTLAEHTYLHRARQILELLDLNT